MKKPTPPVTVKPGKLMAGMSEDTIGLENYKVKRDVRRYLDREMRAEGFTGLVLNQTIASGIQVTPAGSASPLTVIAQARRGDGKRVIVAGNQTTLWACTTTDDTRYVVSATGASDYFAADPVGVYVDETQYGWIQIASGLSTNGRRWEAVAVADWLVLNNGVDLPLTYRPGDSAAFPIYELREQQVASVGTIAAHSGNLLVMDLQQISDADFATIMTPASGVASQDANGVVSGQSVVATQITSTGLTTSIHRVTTTINSVTFNAGFGYQLPVGTKIIVGSNDQGLAGVWQVTASTPSSITIAAIAGAGYGTYTENVTISLVAFPTAVVGLTLFWASGQSAMITSISANGVITTNLPQAIPQETAYLENPLAYAVFTGIPARFPGRLLPSMPGLPRRFGSIIPVSAPLNSRQLVFQYPVRSLPELVAYNQGPYLTGALGGTTDIAVLYAGVGAITLTTSVASIATGIAMSCQIADPIKNPIYFTDPTGVAGTGSSLEASDAANSYAGTYIDIVDDAGAILKALQLQSNIIVYKETPFIYIGTFTGDSNTPYQFQKIALANEGQSLKFRNVLIASGGGYYGSCHIYAGSNAFYKFDLFTQTPQEIPELLPTQELFFSGALANPDAAFAAENPLTREWYFGWGGTGSDTALCYDYAGKTCRTTSAPMTCAAKIQHPTRSDWLFVFADLAGGVQRYGLWSAPIETPTVTVTLAGGVATASAPFWTVEHVGKTIGLATGDLVAITGFTSSTAVTFGGTAPNTSSATAFKVLPGIWHRNGAGYSSIIESGMGALDIPDSDKMVNRYVAIAASQSRNTALQIGFKAGVNPGSGSFIQAANIVAPQSGGNLTQPTFIAYYVGNRITISGVNNPFELIGQLWGVEPVMSKSAGRVAPAGQAQPQPALQYTLPTIPVTGFAANQVYSGPIPPNGIQVGIPGDIYNQIVGGVFVQQFIKGFGTGNTGWE